jgi:ligand-binding SRPBCC domain-containing protein
MSRVYVLKTVQKIPADLETVWKFFSRPDNLQKITPKDMKFIVTNPFLNEEAYPGEIITYKVSPVFNISMRWVTEITQVKHHEYFVDEQRFGPYAMWHHEHHFKIIDGGVEMTDMVYYKIPYWFIGDIANRLIVRKKLRQIFNYRNDKIEELFGKWKGGELKEFLFY